MEPKSFNSAIYKVDWMVKDIIAFTTTRHCPASVEGSIAPFDSFNLGDHVGDSSSQVLKNRQVLKRFLPNDCEIQWLNQVHGSTVAKIEAPSSRSIQADAQFTNKSKIALAIMTADCLPILLSSKCGTEVAAIHGGWKCLAAGIIENTVKSFSLPSSELVAWLGPCIGKNAFEVGREVVDCFIEKGQIFSSAFHSHQNSKYFGDLQKIASIQLKNLGLQNISSLQHCTYSDTNNYFSYRREPVTGRMATLICKI